MEIITSTANARVKQLIQLQKKAKMRNEQDVFVVEGIKMFREIPPGRLIQTFASESFYQKNESMLKNSSPLTLLSDHVFESVSDTRTPQGVLALVRQYHYGLEDLLGRSAPGSGSSRASAQCEAYFGAPFGSAQSGWTAAEKTGMKSMAENPLVLALENLQDPGNLGTILRTAEGAGATGILLGPGCADIYNSKVIRSTMGSVYRMPFYYTDDLRRDILVLREKGVCWHAAHLEGSVPYDEADYCGPSGILIGNESKGLTAETAALADRRVCIPMCGQVESLNAAVAASILVYEANRQRRNTAGKRAEKSLWK